MFHDFLYLRLVLYIYAFQALYMLGDFEQCAAAGMLAALHPSLQKKGKLQSDARYLVSCALMSQKKYKECHTELAYLLAAFDERDDALLLISMACARMNPPIYEEGVTYLDRCSTLHTPTIFYFEVSK